MPEVSDMAGYAASTPVTDGQHVCAIFPNGFVVCLDRNGKRLWSRSLGLPDNTYGHASSLVGLDGRVIVQCDQGTEDDGRSYITALDIRSGRPVWRQRRETAGSWATPLAIGHRELVTCAQPWVISYDPATGREPWRAACISGEVAPSPIYAGGLVFTVSDRSSLTAIRPGGSGDVTTSHVVWTATSGLPDTCSPVSDGKLVFLLTSTGLLTCLQAADGAPVWEKQIDAEFRASPSLAGDKLYLVAQSGETFVVAVDRQFRLCGRSPLGEPVSASPAFAPHRIYLRGERNLFCIGR